MHLLFAQFTVRWLALVTGAAHATCAMRSMARHAPPPDADPDEVPLQRPAARVVATPLVTRPKPA